MKLLVNGEPLEHQGEGRIRELLDEMGVNPKTTALMLNGAVVTASRWDSVQLKDGDTIDLVVFACGG